MKEISTVGLDIAKSVFQKGLGHSALSSASHPLTAPDVRPATIWRLKNT